MESCDLWQRTWERLDALPEDIETAERDWRSIMVSEALARWAEPYCLEVEKLASGLTDSAAVAVSDAVTAIICGAAEVATALMAGAQNLGIVPDSPLSADCEMQLARLLRAGGLSEDALTTITG